ncbi:single-stranded DNA-binding protein [Flavobacterium sp. LHD-80]|uniref:single-stranded DNA-binding protein n=1 Tax=Flavobacterium sp. LHD-80 TaxID=3071411 RepID=UPI0027DF9D86|nr:single-stranded DNA-binding protein [Flavobacterium sp. LHD-80]MDQ6469908.1 single-stranded DNA-binding protein [Flavobacterium sp. LHD-80]
MNITGRVTRDAKVSTLSNSRQVVNFSVAVNESYRNKKGEKVEQTTFFECAYWISAKVASILTKGALVELAGRVSARAWNGTDGEPRAGLNFTTSQITLHAGGRKAENPQEVQSAEPVVEGENKKVALKEPEDDLPF